MKRTAEKVLAIISAAFTAIGIISSLIGLAFLKAFTADSFMMADFEAELLADPSFGAEEMDVFYWMLDLIVGFSWFFIIALIISLLLIIVGIVNVWNNKNPKLAGILFIIAGLFGGILTLTSILLYIAGILCLTKKSPLVDENPYSTEPYDGSMRPL